MKRSNELTLNNIDEIVVLTVRQPYADLIVDGRKIWEIRKIPVNYRGHIVIVSEGKAIGQVKIVDVKGPFDVDELLRYKEFHFADETFLRPYSKGRKLWAWVLADAERFDRPVDVEIISVFESPLRRGRLIVGGTKG